MKHKKIILFFILFICLEMLAFGCLFRVLKASRPDKAAINELMLDYLKAWPSVQEEAMEGGSASEYSLSLLKREEFVTGEQNNGIIFFLMLIIILFPVLFCAFCLLYLDWTIVRPFKTLKSFASRVAEGNLEIPLSMDKHNEFGAFTESFDLMRTELIRARRQEYLAAKSKKELVAQLSHDIKTPVASIRAVAEVMALSALDKKMKDQLEIIEVKADQIDSLISNLFHATLEELKELTVHTEEESSEVITGLLGRSDYLKRAKIGKIPECLVYFDRLRLQQVFDNLFSNSYKYADTAISIRGWLEQERLVIEVKDFGKGVAQEEVPMLFGKFYRGTNSGAQNGAGLGLYISKYLVERMGGAIRCQSTADGFSVFVELAAVI